MKRERRRGRLPRIVTWNTVCDLALTLPESTGSTSYGTPAFKVRGKLFVRLHQSGHSVVVRIDLAERVMRLRADPNAFYVTDHYTPYPWMLVRLSAVRRDDLADLLEESWRLCAQKRLLALYDEAKNHA
jgi:hypothetical protein